MIYTVREPFTAKSGEVRKGQVVAMPEDKAKVLLREGKITELSPCPACREYAWWLSMHGALLCGVCYPPASPNLVKRWIGDPEACARSKALPSVGSVELIGGVIREIEKTYASGAVRWCQRERPEWWKKIITLEERINKTAKDRDIPHLESLLQNWKEEITSMVRAFIDAGV